MGNSTKAGWRRFAMCALVAGALQIVGTPLASAQSNLTVALPFLRQHFDPTQMVTVTDWITYEMIFDGLINLTPEGKQPALATSWDIAADGKSIDFYLREGVTFHDGSPFTAEDVKFTFERVISDDGSHSARAGYVEGIERVDVIAPHHARFILKGPWLAFFTSSRLALQSIVPKAYYEEVGPQGFQEKPIGTGPFVLDGLLAGEWTRFKANPNYWNGAPAVDEVTQRLVSEAFTRYAMLERGEADIVMGLSGPLLERASQAEDARVMVARYAGTSALYFKRSTFTAANNPLVRQAIGYAIDREEIARTILKGVCDAAHQHYTPATFGFREGIEGIPYDPDKARALLSEAEFDFSKPLTMLIHTQAVASLPSAPQVLEAAAGYLEAVGFNLTRQPTETSAFIAGLTSGDTADIFYGPSSQPDDGSDLLRNWFSSWAHYNPRNLNVAEYDNFFHAQSAVTTLEEREKILQDFALLESQRNEAIPLFWCHQAFGVGPKVAEWSPVEGSGYHLYLQKAQMKQ